MAYTSYCTPLTGRLIELDYCVKCISIINMVDRKNSISLDMRKKTAGHSKKARFPL